MPAIEPIEQFQYRLVLFRPLEVVKGNSEFRVAEQWKVMSLRRDPASFSVLVTASQPFCHRPAKYLPGRQYVLFLDAESAPFVFGRTPLDWVWQERPLTDQLAGEVRAAIQEQTAWRTGAGAEALGRGIPAAAEEREVPLTESDKRAGRIRRAVYMLNNVQVGERLWWPSGQLAYEKPMKNGREDGLSRGWYPNGKLRQERLSSRGRLHGPLRAWDEQGVLSTTYWLQGQNVLPEAYEQAAQLDPALPPMRAIATSRPASTQPNS